MSPLSGAGTRRRRGDTATLAAIHAWSAALAPVIDRVVPADAVEGAPVLLIGRRLHGAAVARFGETRTWALPLSDRAVVALVPSGAHGTTVAVERGGLRSNAVPYQGAAGPRIVRADPEDGTAGIWRDPVIVLRASHALDRASIDERSVTLSGPSGLVRCRLLASPDRRAVVGRPLALLEARARYVIRASGLRDVSGRTLPSFASGFTTGSRGFGEEGA